MNKLFHEFISASPPGGSFVRSVLVPYSYEYYFSEFHTDIPHCFEMLANTLGAILTGVATTSNTLRCYASPFGSSQVSSWFE